MFTNVLQNHCSISIRKFQKKCQVTFLCLIVEGSRRKGGGWWGVVKLQVLEDKPMLYTHFYLAQRQKLET